ncbi:MAG: major capsid protein [Microviridae sp.]|nr:MAG: major capsid protein [Microviridae sp.]
MKNYRQNQFDNLQKKQANKSLFDLSHEVKTQMCFGRYYPILYEECLPGDEWTIDGEYQFRFPSTYFPIQQIGTMRADWFYVPYKLLWQGMPGGDTAQSPQKYGWQGFIMGENLELPVTSLNINGTDWNGQPLSDYYPGCSYPIENYLGFPMDKHGMLDINKQMSIEGSAFPLSMYLFCYDEYYRNPQWEEPVFTPLQDGNNDSMFNNGVTQTINGVEYLTWERTGSGSAVVQHPPFFAYYEKDYFTTARPQPQDGDAILIPSLGIEEDGTFTPQRVYKLDGTNPSEASLGATGPGGPGNPRYLSDAGDETPLVLETNASIKQLRIYQVLQQFHERVIRIGKRYRGYIVGLWGNDPEPNAVDIPQLIGSHFGRIQISDTLTTADTSDSNTGNYRGNINFHNNGTTHRYYCQDYGGLMCIINLMPNTSYSQGIHPMWTREVNTDFALDMFSGIGDQEIKRKELWATNFKSVWMDPDEPANATIGYQDRFAEYKTRVNRVFNTNSIYDSFYMGQILEPADQAAYETIDVSTVMLGVSNVQIGNGIREVDIFNQLPIKDGNSTYLDSTIYAHMYFTLKVKRCLPYFSTPGKMII